jgi:hypothetical protein
MGDLSAAEVSKADWLEYQAKQTLVLSDKELEGVAGGTISTNVRACCHIKSRP